MGRIIITIVLVNIEITIIQTIVFEFENVAFGQRVSPNSFFVTENFEISPQKRNTQNGKKNSMFQSKMINTYVSSCSALSIKHL